MRRCPAWAAFACGRHQWATDSRRAPPLMRPARKLHDGEAGLFTPAASTRSSDTAEWPAISDFIAKLDVHRLAYPFSSRESYYAPTRNPPMRQRCSMDELAAMNRSTPVISKKRLAMKVAISVKPREPKRSQPSVEAGEVQGRCAQCQADRCDREPHRGRETEVLHLANRSGEASGSANSASTVKTSGRFTSPWMRSLYWNGSMAGTLPWFTVKRSPLGVIMRRRLGT